MACLRGLCVRRAAPAAALPFLTILLFGLILGGPAAAGLAKPIATDFF